MSENKRVSPELMEAVRVAVRKAYAEVRAEDRKAERKKMLHNTRKLMESYRDLKAFVEKTITEEDEVKETVYEIFKGENARLNSSRRAKMTTAMMILNIDRALEEIAKEHERNGTSYKYEAFAMHYIDGLTYEEIASRLHCGKNSPAMWSKIILKQMSVKLFGINGL